MNKITQLKKLFKAQKNLFIVFGTTFVTAASAQSHNGYWDDRFGPPNYLYDYVSAITVIDNNIYIGGSFTDHNSVATWNGKGWSALGKGVVPPPGKFEYGSVVALAVLGNDLYAGGSFAWAGHLPANKIAKWNLITKSWSALESNGNNGVNGTVWALAVHGNKLYAGGQFTIAGGMSAKGIAVWDDSSKTWTPLGQGVEGIVRAIAVHGKNLYAGGIFASAGGKPANSIAKWNGKEWSPLGSGISPEGKPIVSTPHVNAITILGDEVYVGGGFIKAGDVNANSIAKWNIINKSWSALGSGDKNGVYSYFNSNESNGTGNVEALAANDHAIYVGGTFIQAGGQNANNIAKWDPSTNSWSSLVSGLMGQAFAITIAGKNVHVGGGFTYAGGKRANRFAIWHEPNAQPVLSPLLELRFNEDRLLFQRLHHWYPFVSDADDADSTLKFTVLSGKQVKTTRHPRGYSFSAPLNWFGRDTMQVIVTDPSQLADTTALVITVDPVNDKPQWTGLPDSLSFKQGAAVQLKMWEFVEDVETPDSLLLYRFTASKPGLRWNFHRPTGTLVLTAPQFHGRVRLFVKAGDGKAAAYDTIVVRVEIPNETVATVAKQNSSEPLPTEFVLQQNYPNPFNPTTLIRFGLPREAEVKLEVLNLNGQLVATLLNEHKAAGYHEVLFDAGHLPSGNYFTVLRAGEVKLVRRILLMK